MAEGSEKKRKRTGEPQSQRKQKRVTTKESSSLSSATFSSILQPQLSPPVIATVPGLRVAESVCFDSYTKPPKRSSKSKRNDTTTKELILHSSAHRTVDYTGKEDGATGPLLKHYIGIFDPTNGQVQAVEARKLIIRSTVRAHRAPAESMTAWTVKQTANDLKTELGETFGTKKAKKAIRERTENAISPKKHEGPGSTSKKLDAGERALMESLKTTTAAMATREDLQAAVDLAKPVPKGNYDAEVVQDVYLPDEIMGAEVLSAIPVRDWQVDCEAGKDIQLLSRFAARRITRIAAHEEAVQRLRILRCLYWLIRCWQMARPGNGKDRGTWRLPPPDKLKKDLEPAPRIVTDKLRRTFSDQGTMRKFHMDLLMTHCCVLALILDNFEVKVLDLAEDLKLEQKQLGQYFMEVGARLRVSKTGDKTETIARLSLPLAFPQLQRRRRQG